jgi:threonine aldolase
MRAKNLIRRRRVIARVRLHSQLMVNNQSGSATNVANGAISQDTVEAINRVIVRFQAAAEVVLIEETIQEEEEEVAVTTKTRSVTIVTRWDTSRRTVSPRKGKNRMIRAQLPLLQEFRNVSAILSRWI